MAAGTVTITIQTPIRGAFNPVTTYTIAWTSDAAGNVNGTLSDYINGTMLGAEAVPGSAGAQPTNGYSATLYRNGGTLDLFSGQGAALSNAATVSFQAGWTMKDSAGNTTVAPIPLNNQLELRISGAGNAKSGTIVIYVR